MDIPKSLAQAATVARFTIKEALRNRLAWLALALVCLGLGLAAFLGEISLTETRQIQAIVVGEFFRLASVLLMCAFVITSMVREFNDKVLELLLALPVDRATYCLGKYGGFAAVAVTFAVLFALPLAVFAGPWPALLWGTSLAMELLIIAALALLYVFTLTQVVPALCLVLATYVLSRSMASLQLMARSPLTEEGFGRDFMEGLINLIAFALPRLDLFAPGEWLAYGTANPGELLAQGAQASVFILLMGAAALFDFHRRNL